MSTTLVVIIVIAALVIVAVAAMAVTSGRRTNLRRRYGSEYDRLVAQGDRGAAERELRDRERRHARLELRPLSPAAQAGYTAQWEQVQARFVDAPQQAVGEAEDLVARLTAERGYPGGDFDEQAAMLSVEHPGTVGHYRDAHDLHLRNQRNEATTEQLRQALVHYRALIADLLGTAPGSIANGTTDARSTDTSTSTRTPTQG